MFYYLLILSWQIIHWISALINPINHIANYFTGGWPVCVRNLESWPLWPPGRTLGGEGTKNTWNVEFCQYNIHIWRPIWIVQMVSKIKVVKLVDVDRPPTRPPARHSDNIIPRHINGGVQKQNHFACPLRGHFEGHPMDLPISKV